ncbi:hypothetical protein BDP55DRAFT_625941 [Colletotrichum godetiae]|uniref:Uncharacterized protein n=1 Tax=Colletotrichum godetiae TaxID=1209918 RepID=A0AAJ0F4D3_9PEZI|nr:uncharacterized protein BDP55DRAFT_625941 [Colletotrichum godetiae]KAK1700351.1 hypothetical protein BDP55DRAFT_625941 [Colletotrichum godetiae]
MAKSGWRLAGSGALVVRAFEVVVWAVGIPNLALFCNRNPGNPGMRLLAIALHEYDTDWSGILFPASVGFEDDDRISSPEAGYLDTARTIKKNPPAIVIVLSSSSETTDTNANLKVAGERGGTARAHSTPENGCEVVC